MMWRRDSRLILGLAAIAVVAVGVPVALARHGDASVPTVRVAPLSATDREVLTAGRQLIEALPQAIAEIPGAASDVAGRGLTPAKARSILAATPALVPLARALSQPTGVTGPLLAGYRAVLAGQPVPDADQLASALETLQTVQGDIGPAVRLVAARGGHRLGAAAALTAIESDARQPALASLMSGWQQVYGSFTLVEQAASS
jgi:hypothetical protein